MWITMHLLTPNFHLHFISQSYFCSIISFSFIFTSANRSKYGKSNPRYEHDGWCWMVAPVISRMLWCCPARPRTLSPNPISCRPPAVLAGKGKNLIQSGRIKTPVQCVCVCCLSAYASRWPTHNFRRLFHPPKCSGYSPSFVYKLSENPFICPTHHYTFTKQLMQSQTQIHTTLLCICMYLLTLQCPPFCIFIVNTGTAVLTCSRSNTCQQYCV